MSTGLHDGGDPLARHTLSPRELKRVLAAEHARKPFVVFRDAQGELVLRTLDPRGATCTIGRRPEADISLAWDREVSGLHAELVHLGGEWTIVDDGLSTNGTFINDERTAGRQRLRDKDRIRVGQTTLTYRVAGGVPTSATVAAGKPPSLPQLTDSQRRVLVALCRPYRDGGSFATPASNQQIADEAFLSVDAVKMHLRTLFSRLGLSELPQNQKRAKLAEYALQFGVISPRELE